MIESPQGGGVRAPVRRLVAVAPNASIDKTVAVDRLEPGAIHRPEVLSVVAGGKSVNVCRAATALGLTATVVTILAGHAGSWVEEGLAGSGVAARVIRVAGETRQCLSILDRSTGRLTELYEAGPRIDEQGWDALEAALRDELAVDPEGTAVAMSGSLPGGAPQDGYRRLLAIATASGARTVVDVGGRALTLALGARPWLAKVNDSEAAEATGLAAGGETEALAAARALRTAGAGIAFVSRGVRGAVVVDETGAAWRVGPPPELGLYSVGSGDSLLAGFVAAIAEGYPTAEAARRGSAAAAANALRPGQGDLLLADVARLLPGVSLDRLGG